MGKGDKRSRRGKIFAGSYGKTRQKPKSLTFVPQEKTAAPAPAVKEAAKPKIRKKVSEVKAEEPAAAEVATETKVVE